ncbi:MAG: N,N'-diacetylchitobiose phosphorylase [Clostridiales bacterium]
MQFGYFDDTQKEYVVTKPDTPLSWSNYLGSTDYGAIITNNAGGYSFFKSAAQGRFTRLRFNNVPMDQPGRYIYIHDKETKDYWSNSWQPVGKPLDKYKSECRNGTAYTKINSEYSSIITETNYFVPLGKNYECWLLKVKNNDNKKRKLSLFTYIEYSNNWNLMQDFNNLQYSQYILKMDFINDIIDHGTNVYMPEDSNNFENNGQSRHTFLGLVGAKVVGFDTDRKKFLGTYNTYSNPKVVEDGKCTNSISVGDNGCGTLQFDITLDPKESKEVVIIMGIGKAKIEGTSALKEISSPKKAYDEYIKVKNYWHSRLEGMEVETPDKEFNSMMNMWNPYNCLITYSWSRAASLVYSGERDGLGYRDTIQDILGVLPTIADEAGKRLELMITGQVSTGGAMPVVKPFAHCPGKENPPKENEYRSDDCLWLFNTIPAYVKETGDISFFEKILPYSDHGEDTVLNHMKRAIEFNLERLGNHGLPCGLFADWNDCLELGHNGETVFVAFQLRYALKTYIEVCKIFNINNEINWAKEHLDKLDNNLEKNAWDGSWYLRAFRHDGLKFGSKENDEASIFLNPQTWSIYSEHVTEEKAKKIMKTVEDRLSTDYGIMICDPPVEKTDPKVIKARLFNKGMKENGAIFCHTQGWAVIAESIIGNGDKAYKYFRNYMPASFNTKAEIRETEPYVYSQSTHSKYSPRYGASRLPWLSGTASWAYFSATQYLLGIQPEYEGLKIDPCIPKEWQNFKVTRKFRNKIFNITVNNKNKVQKGVKTLKVNGNIINSNLISTNIMKDQNEVIVEMG